MLRLPVKLYRYVGPPAIAAAAEGEPGGAAVRERPDLVEWIATQEEPWATYVVDPNGTLLVAPRRSEHVACAGGKDVRAAGELRVEDDEIVEVSNLSTGYCPEVSSWEAVREALERAEIPHPGGFTFSFEFRRCDKCGERNVIKDEHYACSVCDAPLSKTWNF